jgi:hypothetical protein
MNLPEWFPEFYIFSAAIALCIMYVRDKRRRSEPGWEKEFYAGAPKELSEESLKLLGPITMIFAALLWPMALVGVAIKGFLAISGGKE